MHMNLSNEEILYDEIDFLIEFAMSNIARKTIIHIGKYQLDHMKGHRHQPFRNSINLTKNEYLDFL